MNQDAGWGDDLLAMMNEPWPTEAELDSIMLEDAGPEPHPRRNADLTAAQHMTPHQIVLAARKHWHVDFDVQIATLQRLTRECERLVWPLMNGSVIR